MARINARLLATLMIVPVTVALVVGVSDRDGSGEVDGCAEMADAVGLYPGNDVTMRGVRIGRVTDIAPEGGAVRVSFRLDRAVDFPVDVSAVTTSDSIVTDRRLEIPAGRESGPAWDMRMCIPRDRTHTPKSVSEAFSAYDKLSSEVTAAAASSPRQRQLVKDSLTRVDDSLKGSSADFNTAVRGLAAALGDPALRDAQLRSLLTNVDELTGFFVERWPDLELGLTELGSFAETFDAWFAELNPTVVETTKLTPSLLRLIRTYSPLVFEILDAAMPLLDRVPMESIIGVIKQIPPISDALRRAASARRGDVDLVLRPPRVRVSATGPTCVALNAALPASCRSVPGAPGRIDTDLLSLVLNSVRGAR